MTVISPEGTLRVRGSTLITDKIHLLISLEPELTEANNRIITIFQTGQRSCGDPVVAIHFRFGSVSPLLN